MINEESKVKLNIKILEKATKLRNELNEVYDRFKAARVTGSNLKDERQISIDKLKQSNENLAKVQEGFPLKKEELEAEQAESEAALGEIEEVVKKLTTEVGELEALNQELKNQNEELKGQANGIFTKSLAILGVFVSGFWTVSKISEWVKSRTTGQTPLQ